MRKLSIIILFLFLTTAVVFAQEPDQQFQGFNLQGYTDTGDKSWDVKGDTADINGSEITLSNVDANTYGDQKMNVTAQSGTIDQINGNMKLEKDVVITSETGGQLLTESLQWNKTDDLVSTDDDVFISDESFTARGKGLTAKPGLKNAKINEDVTVQVDTKKTASSSSSGTGGYVTVTSDGPMVIDQVLNKARFEVNVEAINKDQILKADVMEIYFNDDMSGVTEMICIGNVKITQGENTTYADKATYSQDTQKVVLSGRPKLKIKLEEDNGFPAFRN